MGLLNNNEMQRAVLQRLLKRQRPLTLLLFLATLALWGVFPTEREYTRGYWFDENALMASAAPIDFHGDVTASKLSKEFAAQPLSHRDTWLRLHLAQLGIVPQTHNFTVVDAMKKTIHGTNTYGIIKPSRASGDECLVLHIPLTMAEKGIANGKEKKTFEKKTLEEKEKMSVAGKAEKESNAYAVGVALAMAKHIAAQNVWAKNVVILFTRAGRLGLRAFLDDYHSGSRSSVSGGGGAMVQTHMHRAGSLQGAISLLMPSSHFRSVRLHLAGENGQLPNLDFLYSIIRTAPRVNLRAFVTGEDQRQYWGVLPKAERWKLGVNTMALHLREGASCAPPYPHSPFLGRHVPAITIQAEDSGEADGGKGVNRLGDMGRLAQATLRILNNLCERMHVSVFLYVHIGGGRFVSIGNYAPAMAPLFLLLLLRLAACLSAGETKDSSGPKHGGSSSDGSKEGGGEDEKTRHESMPDTPGYHSNHLAAEACLSSAVIYHTLRLISGVLFAIAAPSSLAMAHDVVVKVYGQTTASASANAAAAAAAATANGAVVTGGGSTASSSVYASLSSIIPADEAAAFVAVFGWALVIYATLIAIQRRAVSSMLLVARCTRYDAAMAVATAFISCGAAFTLNPGLGTLLLIIVIPPCVILTPPPPPPPLEMSATVASSSHYYYYYGSSSGGNSGSKNRRKVLLGLISALVTVVVLTAAANVSIDGIVLQTSPLALLLQSQRDALETGAWTWPWCSITAWAVYTALF